MWASSYFILALGVVTLGSAVPSVKRQSIITCSLSFKTATSDTCDGIINRFGITLLNFTKWNPSLGTTCASFVAGESYCVRGKVATGSATGTPSTTTTISSSVTSTSVAPTTVPTPDMTSKDGSCGGSAGLTCNGTSFGKCCSVAGWCGDTTDHCTAGCQPLFGACTANTGNISTDGSCGGSASKICQGSTFGNCCSVAGWCGNSSDHCTAGCQSAYGTCSVSTTTSSSTSSSVSPTPTSNVSTNGACGSNGVGKTCLGSTFGNCCSVAGWCGSTTDHCNTGCQSAFGTCVTTNISLDGSCGANGKTCAGSTFGTCCGVSGWCGSTAAHCDSAGGCQVMFGSCASTKLSTDGKCGSNGRTCVGTSYGNCCSSSGFCGSGVNFCAEGCQTGSSSQCTTTKIPSLSGVCGKNNIVCAGGPFDGKCCSTSGFCGKGTGFPC